MIYTVQQIKEKLILTALDMESQKLGAKRDVIRFDSAEYYQPFAEFFPTNEDRYTRALTDLCDLSDEAYKRNAPKIAEFYAFCPGRVAVHILRLSVYFGVQLEKIPMLLKDLFLRAFEMRGSSEFLKHEAGNRLDRSCSELLKEIAANPEENRDQPHFQNKEAVRAGLKGFISLDEVTDVAIACLYEDCARYKLADKCPAYIKAAFLYDHLVGPNAWELFLSRRSPEQARRDGSALRAVGFERIPDLLDELSAVIESRERSPKERNQICTHLQNKYRKQIEEAISVEADTVDRFLHDRIG